MPLLEKSVIGSKKYYVRKFVKIRESAYLERSGDLSGDSGSEDDGVSVPGSCIVSSDSFSAPQDGVSWTLKVGLPMINEIKLVVSGKPCVFAYAELRIHDEANDREPLKKFGGLKPIPKSYYTLVKTEYPLIVPSNIPTTGDITFLVEISYKKFGLVKRERREDTIIWDSGPSLSESFSTLFHDEQLSDFVIICNGKRLKVHKCILAARSPYFSGLFSSKLKEEQDGILDLKDICGDEEAFRILLEYIYTDEAGDLEHCSDVELLSEVFRLADRFQIPGLKTECQRLLVDELTVSNSTEIIQFADKFNAVQLKEAAISKLCDGLDVACKTSEWKLMLGNNPQLANEVISKFFERFKLN